MRFVSQLGGLAGVMLAAMPHTAFAQRADENAATQSSDAFGRSVGNDKSGIYNSDDVRGFNPVDAGNVRIEGLYFDQVDRISSRLIDGNTIRVGIASQRFAFPAPTGLVDYGLTQPRAKHSYSLNFELGNSFSSGPGGSFEFKQPLDGARLGLSGGAGFRNARKYEGGEATYNALGGTLAFRPSPGTEVILFLGDFRTRSDEARPTLYLEGTAGPPVIERGKDLSQTWTGRDSDSWQWGGVVRTPLGSGLRLETGLFQARRDNHQVYADLYTGVGADGTSTGHRIIADRGAFDSSVSGETRLIKQWKRGPISQQVILSLRGRHKVRRFGGVASFDFGPGDLNQRTIYNRPAIFIGAKSRDRVDQLTVGISWSMVSDHGLIIDAGLSRGTYSKAIDFADPLLADPQIEDRPVTWNLSASYRVLPQLALYFGASQGLEEALIAPDVAVNRSEAPPAIRTRQIETGLKFSLTPKLTLVAGAFSITKPYFNLDPSLRYRQLGNLTNRGIEISLTGQIVPGLNVVGGTMFLDPRIAGEAVDTGQIGPRPLGQVRSHTYVTFDWRLAGGQGSLSFDTTVESFSSRVGNAANTLFAAPRTVVNLGARYRFKTAGGSFLIRPQVLNLFDNYGWQVSTSGGWTYSAARSVTLQLVADF
ncbi:MAG: TonB-dependent receptor [Novosphingobium sp.]|uniref:TonB-dependent receptor domain-containing protein n=1 Tax=Novosphingobium sp. TaxID=1874826 RepID=UPI003C7B7F28